VKSLRDEGDVPIFLNAGHTHSLESAIPAAKAGFDSIVYDLSALPFEENIKQTRRGVETLKSMNPAILVEGEIGDIGTGRRYMNPCLTARRVSPPRRKQKQFIESTGVDILAPAVGNMHGMSQTMVQGTARKRLDLARIREIKRASGSFLTLHGGSGTDDHDFQEAIAAGINISHINTRGQTYLGLTGIGPQADARNLRRPFLPCYQSGSKGDRTTDCDISVSSDPAQRCRAIY
jgi:fructose-bisphosphate aldolase, class II